MAVIDQGFDRTVHQFHREHEANGQGDNGPPDWRGVQNAQRTDGAPGAEKIPSFV
jgi:hypothetical protein